jgi:hypothetical protein
LRSNIEVKREIVRELYLKHPDLFANLLLNK